MKRLIIWGASGHARVITEAVRLLGVYEIKGYIDTIREERAGEEFCGARVLGGMRALEHAFSEGTREAFVAIGDCAARLDAFERCIAIGYTLPTVIHPSAVLSTSARITAGAFIAAGAIIGVDARVGNAVIVNTGATVDHECILEDGVHISPGVHLGGRVRIGQGTWIGIGAAVRDGITIGRNTVVGAGAVVTADVQDNVVTFGVPARVVRAVPAVG